MSQVEGPTRGAHYGYPSRDAEGSPPSIAPQRRGSTPMSQTYDYLMTSIPKASPLGVGVGASLALWLLLQKACG
jgi:hypothetical protein